MRFLTPICTFARPPSCRPFFPATSAHSRSQPGHLLWHAHLHLRRFIHVYSSLPSPPSRMESLQDDCPHESLDYVKSVIQSSLGKASDEVFAWIEEKPLGSASIGQARAPRGESASIAALLLPTVSVLPAAQPSPRKHRGPSPLEPRRPSTCSLLAVKRTRGRAGVSLSRLCVCGHAGAQGSAAGRPPGRSQGAQRPPLSTSAPCPSLSPAPTLSPAYPLIPTPTHRPTPPYPALPHSSFRSSTRASRRSSAAISPPSAPSARSRSPNTCLF